MDRLQRELQERGTAEEVNGEALQVTQALGESEKRARFIVFGEMQERRVKPIEETCGACTRWPSRFTSMAACRERTAAEARRRGFANVVCPWQFEKAE